MRSTDKAGRLRDAVLAAARAPDAPVRRRQARGLALPVMVGGRLNEVPKESNSGLPADVTEDVRALGCRPCANLDDMLEALREIGR